MSRKMIVARGVSCEILYGQMKVRELVNAPELQLRDWRFLMAQEDWKVQDQETYIAVNRGFCVIIYT